MYIFIHVCTIHRTINLKMSAAERAAIETKKRSGKRTRYSLGGEVGGGVRIHSYLMRVARVSGEMEREIRLARRARYNADHGKKKAASL